ncbi:IS1634 family transposase [Emergencia timonensis]|uniref:IS1634 family transposase n=1 Tax=Emergencia timonensis TaxID=1776384 RepID=UPI001D082FD6|nr:IS1634 family transposase [Emergencia timonensis]MBS6177761.1 IS1634 family transposase [Clostridiales bacterium]MCB6477255.1 IS1634 family transposase [Emergencia timonensis]
MFLIKEKRKNGTNLCIVQSYRDPITKVSKTKRIMNVGYLEDLQKQYDDPIAHFQEVAKQMTEEYSTKTKPTYLTINPAKSLDQGVDLIKNYGYAALSALYHELKLDVFFRGRQRTVDIDYSLNSIMKLLVYGRILYPGSEKQIYGKKDRLFDKTDFTLDDLYHSFPYFHQYKNQLQSWIHDRICENYGKDTTQMYYYVTNHYFEVSEQDLLQKKGVSREYREDPIIQMGLFVDTNRLPVSYELFPRVRDDVPLLKPALKKARYNFGVDKVVIVDDNRSNNADVLYNSVLSGGNGYIISQTIRNAKPEIKKYVLNQDGFRPLGKDCKIKSRVCKREVRITTPDGKKKTVLLKEKQIVFYNDIHARWAIAEREDVILKSKDIIASPEKYNKATTYGAATYVKNLEYDKKTGAVIQDRQGLYLDEKSLREEEKYDGYYMLLTSELDMSEEEIVDVYTGLWEIENSFRLINSTFHARPDYVSRADHMYTHFSTCFVALTLTRLLELKTQRKYPLQQVIRSLKKCSCVHIEDNYYVTTYYDDVLEFVGNSLGVDFSKRYGTLCTIKENLGATKKR